MLTVRPQRGRRGHGEEVLRLTARLLLALLRFLRESSAISVLEFFFFSRPFRGSAGAMESLRGQAIDSTTVDRQFSKLEKPCMLNLKDLLAVLSFHSASVDHLSRFSLGD